MAKIFVSAGRKPTVRVGPDYGAPSPLQRQGVGLPATETRHFVRATHAVVLWRAETSHAARQTEAVTRLSAETFHAARATAAAGFPSADSVHAATQRASVDLWQAETTLYETERASSALAQAETTHALSARQTLATSVTVEDYVAAKDTWATTVAGCVDNANKDGTDLEVSSQTSDTKDIYIAFDLSKFPASAVITEARLGVYTKSVSATGTMNFFKIADANEGWSETALACSTRPPADGAALMPATWSTAKVGVFDYILLTAAVIARLQARMGVGVVTLLIQMSTLNRNFVFEDGSDPVNGPKLKLVFTVA